MATTTIATSSVQGPYVVAQQPPIIIAVNDQPHPASKYKKMFSQLGEIQILIGIFSLILGCVAFVPAVGGTYAYPASGIWAAIFYIVLGCLGVYTGRGPNNCNVIAGLIFGIIVAITAFSVGIVESTIAAVASLVVCGRDEYGLTFSGSCNGAFLGIHATLAALSFIEFVISIVHSSLCCCGTCHSNQSQGQVIGSTTVTQYPAVQIPTQQFDQTQYYHSKQFQSVPPVPMEGNPVQMQPQHVALAAKTGAMDNYGFEGYPPPVQSPDSLPPTYETPIRCNNNQNGC